MREWRSTRNDLRFTSEDRARDGSGEGGWGIAGTAYGREELAALAAGAAKEVRVRR
jgi:hypothetical protein